MARHGKTVNVKVPRKKIIAALEKALQKLNTDYANQAKLQATYEAEYKKWSALVYKKVQLTKPTDIVVRYHNVAVSFDVPKNLPEEPKQPTTMHEWQYKENKEEIENAIRVLNMCEDEFIATGTYGSITKYL